MVVDHETSIIDAADYIIEIGPGSGVNGGQVIDQGTPAEIRASKQSLIGPFLTGQAKLMTRNVVQKNVFEKGQATLTISHRFNLHDVTADFPINRLIAITGFSGAGKTTLVLDGLLDAFQAKIHRRSLPDYIANFEPGRLKHIVSVDATPVGKNANQRWPPIPTLWIICAQSLPSYRLPRRIITRPVTFLTIINRVLVQHVVGRVKFL